MQNVEKNLQTKIKNKEKKIMAAMIDFFESRLKNQVRDLKLAMYEELYKVSNFGDYHTIIPGVKDKDQVLYLGELSEPVGQTRTVGACAMPEGIGTINTKEKVWSPVEWGEKRYFCADDWKAYISNWALKSGVAIDNFNLTDTDVIDVIMDRLAKAIVLSHYIKGWFGDKTITAYNQSPVGPLFHSKYIPFFNSFDGWLKQMQSYTSIDAETALQRITIAGNAEATYAAQKAWGITASTVAGVDGNKCLEVAYDIAFNTPTFIKQQAGNTVLCTRLFYNCLTRNFIGKGLESMFENLQNGVKALNVLGDLYVPVDEWDLIIQKYLKNGTKYINPYIAVVTPKDNLQYGTTATAEVGVKDVQGWYNIDLNKTFIQFMDCTEAKIAMDTKFILAI